MSVPMRQRAIKLLRESRTLPAIERARYLKAIASTRRSNQDFMRQHPGEPMPPSWLMHDAYRHVDYWGYWTSGQALADYYGEIVSAYLPDLPVSVCDWGCGPARVARHLASRTDVFGEVIGLDYNEKSIDWCQSNIHGAQFRRNQLEPPMPLPDGAVDFLTAFSVFTHLSEQRLSDWLAEMKRVVRPGGVILFTTHGDGYREKLLPEELAAYEADGVVARGSVKEGSRLFATFTSPAYIRRLAAPMELLRHDDKSLVQDTWVYRRP
jgi:SAM-dependent methyltransferase